MSVTTLPEIARPMTLTDAELRFYKEQGYLRLPGFINAEDIDDVREEILDVLEANGVPRAALTQATGTADKLRQCNQYLADSKLDALINGATTLSVAAQLVDGRPMRYQPFTAVKGGGGKALDYHQDNNYTQHDNALGTVNIWVALVDMTPENGALRIVPRSHLNQQLQSRESADGDQHRALDIDEVTALPIRMRAGDAVAFTRWTVHGSGPNTTRIPRVAMALTYHRDDVKWLDKETGEWHLLVENPRFVNERVSVLGPQ